MDCILFTISLNSAKVWTRGFNWPVFGVGMHKKSPNGTGAYPEVVIEILFLTTSSEIITNSRYGVFLVTIPLSDLSRFIESQWGKNSLPIIKEVTKRTSTVGVRYVAIDAISVMTIPMIITALHPIFLIVSATKGAAKKYCTVFKKEQFYSGEGTKKAWNMNIKYIQLLKLPGFFCKWWYQFNR